MRSSDHPNEREELGSMGSLSGEQRGRDETSTAREGGERGLSMPSNSSDLTSFSSGQPYLEPDSRDPRVPTAPPRSSGHPSTTGEEGGGGSSPRGERYPPPQYDIASFSSSSMEARGPNSTYAVGKREPTSTTSWHVDPVPLVSDDAANPTKYPAGMSSDSSRLPPSLHPVSSDTGMEKPHQHHYLGGGGGGGLRPSTPPAFPSTFHAAEASPSIYPTATFVPPPEELITMGVTLEEYQRHAAEAEAIAAAQRQAAAEAHAIPYAPYWLISCLDVCGDKSLVLDAICCSCCLLSAHCESLLHPERVQNTMASNCNCPLAGCFVCLTCTAWIVATSASSFLAKDCFLCGCCMCGFPVVNIMTIVIRQWIRRRYGIRGFQTSSTPPISAFSIGEEAGPGVPRGGGSYDAGYRGMHRSGGGAMNGERGFSLSQDASITSNPESTHGNDVVTSSSSSSSSRLLYWGRQVGELCGDICCGLWCVWCALIQHHRELVYRRVYHGKVVFSNSRAMPAYTIR